MCVDRTRENGQVPAALKLDTPVNLGKVAKDLGKNTKLFVSFVLKKAIPWNQRLYILKLCCIDKMRMIEQGWNLWMHPLGISFLVEDLNQGADLLVSKLTLKQNPVTYFFFPEV